MKIFNVEQRSEEWYALRRGIPTASNFDRILTPSGERSKQQEDYLCELLAERFGVVSDNITTPWTERGRELEDLARLAYSLETGADVERVGFVLSDRGYGASPDGLIGGDGLLEIKCLKPANHVKLFFDVPAMQYMPQLQGQLLVCERKWVDLFFFCPGLPSYLVRIVRRESYINKLRAELDSFVEELQRRAKRLEALGWDGEKAEK